MRPSALAIGTLILVARSSSAANYSTDFSFKMVTDSGTSYGYDEDQSHVVAIKLPAAFVAAGWGCQREQVFLTNSGSGYIGLIDCTNAHGRSYASSRVLCSAKKVDQDWSRFSLGTSDESGKPVQVEFNLSCVTRTGTPAHAP